MGIFERLRWRSRRKEADDNWATFSLPSSRDYHQYAGTGKDENGPAGRKPENSRCLEGGSGNSNKKADNLTSGNSISVNSGSAGRRNSGSSNKSSGGIGGGHSFGY
ncbi:hypothetical protein TRICI_000760 [Trichomonascus ciferrii]|uniref:Uncharacterized protein n=1 Tax=Trichomonascus ciferrii TaxID=44093 RepID=A0A642VB56_9ASCO|nr:hypothetical protein TRICI_000760 [Trichomonascus ciferrii]